jgi:hypothetical protein
MNEYPYNQSIQSKAQLSIILEACRTLTFDRFVLSIFNLAL